MAQSTADYDSVDLWLADADVVVVINDKLDTLMRHRASWLARVGLVVADEVHLLGDPHCGPTLEVVLTRLKWLIPELRLMALSPPYPMSPRSPRGSVRGSPSPTAGRCRSVK